MAKRYYFSEADRDKQRRINDRVEAGHTSQRANRRPRWKAGGSGPTIATIIMGQATTAYIETDATWTLNNLTIMQGIHEGSTVSAVNGMGFATSSGGIVWCMKPADGENFYIFQAECPPEE